jgi:hypothetical protein
MAVPGAARAFLSRTDRRGQAAPSLPLFRGAPEGREIRKLAARGETRRLPDRRPQAGGRVSLWSRYGTIFTDRLPRIAAAVRGLAAESALIDGEAVAFRPDGRSDFGALRTKAGGPM